MTAEELDAAKRFATEVWSLDAPDPIELFAALRILRIKDEKSEPSFDDFMVAYRRLTGG